MATLSRASGFISGLKGGGDRPPFEGIYVYLFALLLGYIIADLSLLKIRPNMLPVGAPPSQLAPGPMAHQSMRNEYDIITQRNIFNADGEIPPALSAEGEQAPGAKEGPAVLSQLPLKLEGTIVHANPMRSVSTIGIQSKNETKAFMVDDEIEGLARITKIERRKVTFRNLNNQRLEYIEIPRDSSITFGLKSEKTTGDGEIARQGEFEFSLRREDINKYTSDLASILNQARMLPNIVPGSGGKVEGFRFVAIQPGSIYEKLGFKVGDVIRSVNDEAVNSPNKAMELYNALRTEQRIVLKVERDGREESFTYDVKD